MGRTLATLFAQPLTELRELTASSFSAAFCRRGSSALSTLAGSSGRREVSISRSVSASVSSRLWMSSLAPLCQRQKVSFFSPGKQSISNTSANALRSRCTVRRLTS